MKSSEPLNRTVATAAKKAPSALSPQTLHPDPIKIEKVELEPTVKKLAENRRTNLVSDLKTKEAAQVVREHEDAESRKEIERMKVEIAEIDAFLARH